MKKILLLITVLILTSCGLFRKSVKTSSSSEHTENIVQLAENKSQVKAELQAESKVVSSEQKQVQKDIDEQTTLTADEIEVKPDGSVKGKGNARLAHSKKDKGIVNTNQTAERNDSYIGHIEAKIDEKEKRKQETKDKVKDTQVLSEPKGSIFVWWWIGIGLAVCLVIWFLRRK